MITEYRYPYIDELFELSSLDLNSEKILIFSIKELVEKAKLETGNIFDENIYNLYKITSSHINRLRRFGVETIESMDYITTKSINKIIIEASPIIVSLPDDIIPIEIDKIKEEVDKISIDTIITRRLQSLDDIVISLDVIKKMIDETYLKANEFIKYIHEKIEYEIFNKKGLKATTFVAIESIIFITKYFLVMDLIFSKILESMEEKLKDIENK